MARPDAPVFPLAAVDHPALRLPFLDVADSHLDAVSLLDAGLCVVRQACLDMEGAIPEVRRGLMDEAFGKLAGRELRLADVVPAHPDPAWAVSLGLPASAADFVERWERLRAEAALYTPDEALSAA